MKHSPLKNQLSILLKSCYNYLIVGKTSKFGKTLLKQLFNIRNLSKFYIQMYSEKIFNKTYIFICFHCILFSTCILSLYIFMNLARNSFLLFKFMSGLFLYIRIRHISIKYALDNACNKIILSEILKTSHKSMIYLICLPRRFHITM